ncbi:MAG TPA: hypothetical protein VF226_06950 [Hyphomicrobiaceae bacterium]
MRNTVNFAALLMGTALAVTTAAQAQQSQQFNGQQMGQQFGTQQFGQPMTGQMQGHQQLTQQSIQNFFQQAQNVLQQTARTQDPNALRQYINQYVAPDAEFTTISQLFVRDRHVATTVAEASDEMVSDALGYAANMLQGRKLVSNYQINIDVRDIDISPSGDTARVKTVVHERGILTGPMAQHVASRVGQARQRMGQLRQQWQQGQTGQGQQQFGQLGQGQQPWTQTPQMQSGQPQGGMTSGMGSGTGAGGGTQAQGIPFETLANCTNDILLEQGQIKLGNTFCRGTMHLGQ